MKTAADYATQAIEGVRGLRYLAARGDAEAAGALLTLATEAAGHLDALMSRPTGHPVRTILDLLAGSAESWPLNIPAVEELRPMAPSKIPLTLGTCLPYRAQKGATKLRDFQKGPSGFALDVFRDLDEIRKKASDSDRGALQGIWHLLSESMKNEWRQLAVLLPALDASPKAIKAWKEAGTRWADDQCHGQWKAFPWPNEVVTRANQKTNSRKRGIETAVKEYLGKGFKSIAQRLPLIKGE